MGWTPSVGEWVTCPSGEGQVVQLDPDNETASVKVDDVVRHFAVSALKPGKPSSAWGL